MNTLDLEQPAKAIEAAISDFQNRHDVNHLLSHVRTVLIRFAEELIVSVVQKVLSDQNVLTTLTLQRHLMIFDNLFESLLPVR